jgi:uncharacterized protein (TIGR01244 family)
MKRRFQPKKRVRVRRVAVAALLMISTAAVTQGQRMPSTTGAASVALAALGVESIDRFHRIDARVAIGGQPTPEQISLLSDAGFQGVVNLREQSEENDGFHARAARQAGMQFYRVPVSPESPSDAAVAKFLAVTDDETLYPIYIYCESGNRAAALWMIRRVLRDGWTLEKAEAEAVAAGLTREPLRNFARGYIERHPATPGGVR